MHRALAKASAANSGTCRKPYEDIVEVGPDHDLRLCFSPAVPVRGVEVDEECFSKFLEGPPEGHREK